LKQIELENKENKQLENKDKQNWEVKYPSIGLTLSCVINTDKDKIRNNIIENIQRTHPRVWPHKEQDTEVIICAGGSSLLDHFDEIHKKQQDGGKVIALANTAHILVENGIRPNAQILLDAKPRNAEFVVNGIETVCFIASQCDPSVFEKAEKTGNKIYLYHAVNNDAEFSYINDVENAWIPIQGGNTITMRAIRLFTILGYSNFQIYGWDSCIMNDRHHAYPQPDADKQKIFCLELEGKKFQLTAWMLSQGLEFVNFVKNFCMKIELNVHGDGLISHIIKTGSLKVNIKEA